MENACPGSSCYITFPKTQDAFNADGTSNNIEFDTKRTTAFINELLWFIESERRMKSLATL